MSFAGFDQFPVDARLRANLPDRLFGALRHYGVSVEMAQLATDPSTRNEFLVAFRQEVGNIASFHCAKTGCRVRISVAEDGTCSVAKGADPHPNDAFTEEWAEQARALPLYSVCDSSPSFLISATETRGHPQLEDCPFATPPEFHGFDGRSPDEPHYPLGDRSDMAAFLVDDCELDEPSTKVARTELSSNTVAFKRVGGDGAKKMELFQFKDKAAIVVLDAAGGVPRNSTANVRTSNEALTSQNISQKTPPKVVAAVPQTTTERHTPRDVDRTQAETETPQPCETTPLAHNKAPNAPAAPVGEKRKLFQSTLTSFFAKPKPAQ